MSDPKWIPGVGWSVDMTKKKEPIEVVPMWCKDCGCEAIDESDEDDGLEVDFDECPFCGGELTDEECN